ncbi:smg-3 [Pristionchus pacificus]|nr:smg-3 [Pristionchus pacificus]|eukprot:PDM75373.1 smg-3 [Pristionchus pacificus]
MNGYVHWSWADSNKMNKDSRVQPGMAAQWITVNDEWLAEVKKKCEGYNESRKILAEMKPLGDQELRKMDSTLKKTTAVMKKIKMLNKEHAAALTADLDKINLSKFVEEMAVAVADTKFKISDLPNVVSLCVGISARYPRFSEQLLSQFRKCIPSKKSETITNPAKLRVDIRLIAELTLHGVFGKEGLQSIGTLLLFINGTEKTDHPSHSIVTSLFSALGWELAAFIPQEIKDSKKTVNIEKADLPVHELMTEDRKRTMAEMVIIYWKSIGQKVNGLCQKINEKKKAVRRQEKTKGDATSEIKKNLEELREEWKKWREVEMEMAIVVGDTSLSKEEDDSADESDEEAIVGLAKALEDGSLSLWPDQDARSFYENTLALRKIVPAALFKDEANGSRKDDSGMASCIDDVDVEMEGGDEEEEMDKSGKSDDYESDISDTMFVDADDFEEEAKKKKAMEMERVDEEMKREIVYAENSTEKKEFMDIFLSELYSMTNRDNIDNAALEYVNNCLNTPINSRRLKHFLVKCARPDILPFYARFLATLDQVMHDFVSEVCSKVLERFRDQLAHYTKYTSGERIATTIMIGELIKFGVIPRAEGLVSLRQLVFDFRLPAVEMLCTFVENCGFYLFRNPDSHSKMKTLLDVMHTKKKRIKDVRLHNLLDNAYFSVLPPEEQSASSRPSVPPILRFIRRLVTSITEETIVAHLKCIRKLDWTDSLISEYTIALLSSPWIVSIECLPHLASLVGGLNELPKHDWIAVAVVDNVLETIRLSLEKPRSLNQEALACVVYVGELYNFCVCNSQVVFKTLYQVISFPDADPYYSWKDLSRIRMVISLVVTVGEFFRTSRKSTSSMMCFLAYFYRFYWMKREGWTANAPLRQLGVQESFPKDVESSVRELHKEMLKGRREPKSIEDAEDAVRVVERNFKAKVDYVLRAASHYDEGEGPSMEKGLQALREEEEDDDDERNRYNDGGDEVLLEEDTLFGKDESEMEMGMISRASRISDEEDDEFSSQLDKMMNDAIKSSQYTSVTSPPSVNSISSALNISSGKVERSNGEGRPQILLRGKNNRTTLKEVDVKEERLERVWKENIQRKELERAHLKKLTLAHSARQYREEEEGDVPSIPSTQPIPFVPRRL